MVLGDFSSGWMTILRGEVCVDGVIVLQQLWLWGHLRFLGGCWTWFQWTNLTACLFFLIAVFLASTMTGMHPHLYNITLDSLFSMNTFLSIWTASVLSSNLSSDWRPPLTLEMCEFVECAYQIGLNVIESRTEWLCCIRNSCCASSKPYS